MVVASKTCVACVESYCGCDVRRASPGDRQAERSLQLPALCQQLSFRDFAVRRWDCSFDIDILFTPNVPRNGSCCVQKPAAISAHRFPGLVNTHILDQLQRS